MGLNLRRERFSDWLEGFGPDRRADFITKLEKHVGQKLDVDVWQIQDDAYPRVGSYSTYDVFRRCLEYLTKGDYQEELDDDDDVEWEALKEFRAHLKPASLKVPYVAHFLESGDTDTIFIPVLFDRPFLYDECFVASLPGGIKALEAFAKGLDFDLAAPEDFEVEDGKWLPVSTARNVARLLHGFFTQKPDACVALS
jgi:hypothetical protein